MSFSTELLNIGSTFAVSANRISFRASAALVAYHWSLNQGAEQADKLNCDIIAKRIYDALAAQGHAHSGCHAYGLRAEKVAAKIKRYFAGRFEGLNNVESAKEILAVFERFLTEQGMSANTHIDTWVKSHNSAPYTAEAHESPKVLSAVEKAREKVAKAIAAADKLEEKEAVKAEAIAAPTAPAPVTLESITRDMNRLSTDDLGRLAKEVTQLYAARNKAAKTGKIAEAKAA